MGIAAGPNVSRDGLVLYYDIANIKSFRGEPTTNLTRNSKDLSGSSYASSDEFVSLPTYNSALSKSYNSSIRTPVGFGATLIKESGNTGYHYLSQWGDTAESGAHFISCYVFPVTQLSSNFGNIMIGMLNDGNNSIIFNLYTGEITYGSEISNRNAFIEPVKDYYGWFRIGANIEGRLGGWVGCIGYSIGSSYTGTLNAKQLYITGVQYELNTRVTAFAEAGVTRGTTVATGGGMIDLSGNSNSGELVNGPTYSSSFGGVVSFDGTNDHVKFPSISLTSITVSVWVRSSSWSTQTHPMIIAKGINVEWILWKSDDGGNDEKFGWRGSATIYSTTTAQNNVWYHLVASIGSSGMKLYVNGVLEASNGTTTFSSGSNEIALATGITNGTPGNYLLGDISIAKIWNRQLTDAQVKDIYNATRVRFQDRQTIVTNGLVLNLDASNRDSYIGTGNTWFDLSGFGNTGTLTNGPLFSTGNGGDIQFDGVNDYVNFGDVTTTEFGTGDFTLSSWIFIPADVVENVNFFKGIIIKKGANAANAGYGMYYNTGQKKFLWSTADGTSAQERFSSNTWDILKGQWSNVVMIRQSGATNNGHFYINCVLESISSSATVVNVNNDYNLTIGASSTLFSNYFFQGNIANALIYNRALSETEVLRNYNATKSRFGL